MAFNKHKESDLFILLLTTAFIMPVLATTNIDCKGKAFHCFNSTHFKICVDLGGVSKTVDDFLIPCPPSTVCTENNYFECEYQISTTSAAMPIQSDVTNEFIEKIESTPWELFDVTTLRSVNNVENVTLLENSTITLSEIVSDAVGFEIDNNNTYVNDLLNEEITASYPHNTKKNDLSDSDKSNLPQQVSILNKQLTSTTITSATIDNVSSNISSAAVSENYSGTASDLSIELINTIVTTPLSTGEDVDFTQLFSTVITDNLKKSDSTRKVKNYLTNDISIGVYEPVTTTPMNNIRNNDLISTELLSPLETDNLSTSLATEKSSIYSGSQSKISSNLYKDVTSTSTTTVSEVSAFAKLFSPFKTNDLSPRNSFTTEKSEVLVDLFNSVTKLNNVETEKLNKDFIPTTISFYDNENDINAENVVRSSTDHINFSSFSDYNLESTQKYNTIGPLALATTKANPMSITNVAMKNDNLESSSIKEKKPPINRVDPTSTHTSVADSTLTEIAISSCTESEISIDLNKNVTPSPKNQDYISTKSSYSKKRMDLTPNTTAATKGNIVTKSEILVDLFNPVTKAPLKNVVTEEFNKDLMPTTKYFSENKNYINAENIVKEISSDNINFSSFSDYNLASTQQYTTIPPPTGATTKTNEFNATNVVLNSLESSSINKESTHINRIVNTSAHTSTADSVLEDKVAIFSGTESQPSIDLYKKVIPAPNNQELSSLGNTVSTSTAAPKKYIVTESGISVDLFNTVIPTSLDEKENEELNKDFIPTKKSFLVNENYINAENIGKGSSSDNINLFSFSDYNLLSTQQYTTIGPPTGATTKANELNAMRITNVAKKTNTLESTSINDKNSRTNKIYSTQTSMADFVLTAKTEISSEAESEISMDLYKHVLAAPKDQDYTKTKLSFLQEKVDLAPTNLITTAATKEYTVTESEILVDLFNPVTTTSMNNIETEEINKDNIPTTKSLSANENYIITQNILKEISSDNIIFSSFSDYDLASTQQYTTIGPPTGASTKANELNAMSITNVAIKTNTLESYSIDDKNTRKNRIDSTQTSMADFVLKEKKEIYSDAEREISMDLYKHAIPAPKNQDYTSTKIPSSQEKVDLSPINSITTAATKEYTVTESEILADLFNPVKTTPMNNIENEELNKEYIPTTKSLSANENYLNTQNILKEISSDNINFSSFSDYELASTQQYTTIGPPTGASTKANELNAMSITNLAMKTNTLESYSIDDKTTRINSIDSTQTSMADLVLTEKTEISSEAESVISMDLYKHVIAAPKDQDYTSTKLSFLQEKVDLAPTNSITTAAIKEYTVTESEILVDLFNPVTTTSMNNMETEEINKDNIPTTKSLSANENYIITQNIVNGSSSNNMNFSSLSDYNFASTQQYTTLDPQIQNNTIYNELNAVSFYKNASEFYTNVAMKTSQRLEDSTTAASAADATLVALNNTMEGFSITEQHDFVPLISKSNLISEKIETSSLLDSDGGNVYQSTNMKGVNLQSKASTINLNGWFTNITKKISNGAVKEILMPKNESDIKGTTSPSADFIPKVTNAYSDETNFTAPVNIRLNNTTDLFLIQDNNVLPSPIMLATENIVTKSSDVYDTTIRIIAESHITNTNQDNNMTNANLSILYINNETPLYPSTTENQIPLKTENVTYGMGISKNVTKIDISTRMIINEHNSTSAKPVNLNTKPLIYYNNSYAGSNDNIFSSTNTQTTTENVAKSLSLILQSSEITQTKDSSSREGNILPPLVRDIQNSSFGEAKKTIIFHTSRDLKLDKGSTYSISKKEFPVSTEFILTKTSKNIFNDKIRTIDEDQDNITPALEINNNRISSTSSGMHILVSTDRPSLLRPDLLYNKNKYATNTLKPIPSQLKNSNFQSNTAPAKIQNENTTKGNTILTNHTKANSQITQMQMKKTSIPEKELRVSATPTIDFVDIAIKSKNISTYSILSDNINNENNKIKEEPTKIVSEFGGLNIQDNIAKSVLLSNQQLQNVTHNNANNSQLHKKKNIDSTDYTYNKLILDGNTQSPSFDKIDIALQPLKTKIETISLGVERNNEAKDTLSRNLVNISAINGQLFHKSAESRTIRPNSLMNRSSSFYLPSFKNHTFNNSTSKVINLTNVNNIFLVNFMNKQRESLDTANQSSKFNRTQIITKLVDNSSTSSSNTYNMFILKIKDQFNNKSNNLDKYHNNQNVRKTTVRVLKNDDNGLEKNTNKTNIDLMNRNVFNSETTESKFSCNNRHRGKYSDKNNCQNFYICIGRREPIFGECPNKTVFSEISKQCTKNLSHCIRNNQFQCVSPGRFIDIFSDQFYYICVKKKEGHIRFKLKCQKGYHLNKTNLQCVLDLFNGSKSNEDSTKFDSDKSTTESKSKEDSKRKNEEMKNFKDFECKKEGKFVYQNDCRKYYQCSRSSRTVFRRKIKKCDSDEVFNNEKKKCVDEESYECK